MKRKLSPPSYEAGECSSSGSRRPGHPHSKPWSCERTKTKLTTHVMQDSTLCLRQYLHAPLLCRGTICRVSHQPILLVTTIEQPITRIEDRLFDRGWVRSAMATRKYGNIYFPKYFMGARPFFTRIFFQELFGLEG